MQTPMHWLCGARLGGVGACAALAFVGFGLVLEGARLKAAGPVDKADAKVYDRQIRPFLARHCLECHGGEKPKGDFRLDRLAPDFADATNRGQWQNVVKRLAAGEMPPKPRPRPPEQ